MKTEINNFFATIDEKDNNQLEVLVIMLRFFNCKIPSIDLFKVKPSDKNKIQGRKYAEYMKDHILTGSSIQEVLNNTSAILTYLVIISNEEKLPINPDIQRRIDN